jgi:protein TonB
MLKQETFFDSNLSIPNGVFVWYDAKGNVDSFAQVYKGRKTSYVSYDDNLKPIVSAKYKNGSLFEKRDYLLNTYTDSTGNTSDLKEKQERDKLPDSITTTQKAASFGSNGHNEWNKYVEKHLRVPDRFENVMQNGSYEVVASFLITKEGKVDEVFLMRSCEWSADLEVFKIFEDSPLWQPATQNGNNVIYRQKESFTFSVNR